MAAARSDSTLAASDEPSCSMPNPEKQTNEVEDAEEAEEADIPVEAAAAAADLSLPRSTHSGGIKSSSLHRSKSYGDGHGYTAFGEDEEAPAKTENGEDPKKEFKVQWDGDHDPTNPRNMRTGRKWIVVAIVSAGSTCVTCTSSMYTSTYGQITQEFHVSRVVATLGLSLFVMGLGIGPMVLGPLSEFYGRRPIYVFSFFFFLIWLIPCAVAKNIATELIARFIDGLAGSAFLSVAGGTVGDMFARNELQAPMMVFTASPFVGPPLGPMVAGFINQYTTW